MAGLLKSGSISGLLGGIFRGTSRAFYADVRGLGWKGIAAQGGIGFLEGFGFGFVSGGLASFSAQAFMWMGLKESFGLYAVSGAIGGGGSGAVEGAFEAFFSDASYQRIQDRAIAGLTGGLFGGMMGYGLDLPVEGVVGPLGMDQFMQEFYNFCVWMRDTVGEEDK